MYVKPLARLLKMGRGLLGLGLLALAAGLPTPASAQELFPTPAEPVAAAEEAGIVQVGCSSCGSTGGLLNSLGGGGCSSCGMGSGNPCGGPCYPGRKPCDCCAAPRTAIGRLFYGFYECLCCPDPCFEPSWSILRDAGFFLDAARPQTQMRFRINSANRVQRPDRAEFIWAQIGGKGPRPTNNTMGISRTDIHTLSMYTEGATGNVGVSVEVPYLAVDPNNAAPNSGFGDVIIGTKTMLLECELLQIATGFKTYIPAGAPNKGLGTGHTSLEPSLLLTLKLSPESYLQGQLAYWIPLGGTPGVQGNVFHWHFSYNRLLCSCGKDIQLVGVVELDGYDYLNGSYTSERDGQTLIAARDSYAVSIGPGVRLNLCDKLDFGVGSKFAITTDDVGEYIIRADLRWRF